MDTGQVRCDNADAAMPSRPRARRVHEAACSKGERPQQPRATPSSKRYHSHEVVRAHVEAIPRSTTAPPAATTTTTITPTLSPDAIHLELQVKIRLFKTIAILSRHPVGEAKRREAETSARDALELADSHDHAALVGRCHFYLASALLPLQQHSRKHRHTLLNHLRRALDAAEGGYPEGHWAREWLDAFAAQGRRDAAAAADDDRSPSWSSGLSGSLLSAISFGYFGGGGDRERAESSAVGRLATRGERIPSFESEGSSSDGDEEYVEGVKGEFDAPLFPLTRVSSDLNALTAKSSVL